jgi:nicotinamide-nucleotide amidase
MFTSMAGSSEYYLGSVTSYANQVKTQVLGVPNEVIAEHGAVSEECVAAMAEGVRRITGSDFSVATSGIAGPGGGTDTKPVGLVCIGVSSQMGTETYKMVFKGDRKRNIDRFAANALYKLLNKIKNEINQ